MVANTADNIVKLLRTQLREIENEERNLHRLKDRVQKSLALFGQPVTGVKYTRPNQGAPRKDSHIVVMNQMKAHFAPGKEVHFRRLVELGMEKGLREGQANGGVLTLHRMGLIRRVRKGWYVYENGKESNGGT